MKIHIIIPFILSIITSHLFSQTLEEREKQIAAQNQIKIKTQTDFSYQAGKLSKTGVVTSKTQYARSGEILHKDFFNAKGEITGSEIYEYDRNNNRTLYQRDGTGNTYKKSSAYDAKNNLILEAGFNGSENFRNEFSYNSSNQLEKAIYTINNSIQQKLIYSNSGTITNIETYMKGTALLSRIKMVYDAKGNIIEETTYSIDDRELEKKEYKYNSPSQIVEETKTQKGKFYYRYSYSYDSKGNLLSIYEETLAKTRYAKKIYTYDTAGNLIEYKWRRNPDEEFNSKTYTYDAKGVCLTEHTFYPNTSFELLSKFEYEYY